MPPVPLASIYDPVAGAIYTLEAATQTALRGVIPEQPDAGPAWGFGIPFPANNGTPDQFPKGRPDVKSESLGTKTIHGIEVEGSRITMTWSARFPGIRRNVVYVDEKWISRELGMALVSKHSDASSGSAVMQLENIRREEPDASLFVVPPDYQIVDLR